MGATSPTTWSAHALAHFVHADNYTPLPRLIFLGGRNPANPLIACERRNIRPHILHTSIGLDCFAKIRRHFMHHI